MGDGKKLLFPVLALGLTAVITQVLAMREFLAVFQGNELVFGIVLASWLLLTGIGSYLGKYFGSIRDKPRLMSTLLMVLAFLPMATLFALRALRNVLLLQGELAGITQIIMFSLLLVPYCMLSGSLLTAACSVRKIGWVYLIDSIGSIIGGVLFSFVLILFFNPFQIALMLLVLCLAAAIWLSHASKPRVFIAIFLIGLSVALFMAFDLNTISERMLFRGQGLAFFGMSKYGSLAVTYSDGQYNFYENSQLLFTTFNNISNEETVHYAMVQSANPENVLLIGGGVSGTVDEILKYRVKAIDYVELDPAIVNLGRRYQTLTEDKKLNIINSDARLFIRTEKNAYDVAIIDLPDPNSAQINRFYTLEFFRSLKTAMKSGGVASISLSSSENYLSPETRKLNSALYQTMRSVFKNVIVIPGDRNYFIASDANLSYDIGRLIREKGINTAFVNDNYLKGIITKDRIGWVLNSLDVKARINTDFFPATYFYYFQYWMSQFSGSFGWMLAVAGLLLLFLLSRLKPVSFSIFTIGFAAASLEVVLLVGFQIIYGYAYYQIGIIITAFMAGLAAGAFFMNRWLKKAKLRHFVLLQLAIACYSIALGFGLVLLSKSGAGTAANIIFPVLTIIIGALVGAAFPLAAKLCRKKAAEAAAALYSADFIGSCIGALLVSAILIPLIGIVAVCVIVGALNIISAVLVSRK